MVAAHPRTRENVGIHSGVYGGGVWSSNVSTDHQMLEGSLERGLARLHVGGAVEVELGDRCEGCVVPSVEGFLFTTQSLHPSSIAVRRPSHTSLYVQCTTMPRVHLSNRKRTADVPEPAAAPAGASDQTGGDTEEASEYAVRAS